MFFRSGIDADNFYVHDRRYEEGKGESLRDSMGMKAADPIRREKFSPTPHAECEAVTRKITHNYCTFILSRFLECHYQTLKKIYCNLLRKCASGSTTQQ